MHWVMWQVIETAISISQIAKCGEKRRRWIYTYQREKQQQQRRQRGIYFCWYLIYNNDCDIKLTKITHKWTVDGRSKSGKKTVQNNTQSMQLMSFSTTSPLNWLNRAAFSSLTHSVARIVFCLKYLLDCWWLAGWLVSMFLFLLLLLVHFASEFVQKHLRPKERTHTTTTTTRQNKMEIVQQRKCYV